jgi:hypothetical protein
MILHFSQRLVTDAATFMSDPYFPRPTHDRDFDRLDQVRGDFARHVGGKFCLLRCTQRQRMPDDMRQNDYFTTELRRLVKISGSLSVTTTVCSK